jgi:hypothetical protein
MAVQGREEAKEVDLGFRKRDLGPLIAKLLGSSGSAESHLPPTILYNEGWLLRLVLSAASAGIPCLPFRFADGARWFSEALLYSAFLPRHRGDHLAEAWTHPDLSFTSELAGVSAT